MILLHTGCRGADKLLLSALTFIAVTGYLHNRNQVNLTIVFICSAVTGGDPASCPSSGKWKISEWNVDEPIGKAWQFFEAQQSGRLPADNRFEWRGDSYLNDKHKGRDLSGGWFDAGGALSPPPPNQTPIFVVSFFQEH